MAARITGRADSGRAVEDGVDGAAQAGADQRRVGDVRADGPERAAPAQRHDLPVGVGERRRRVVAVLVHRRVRRDDPVVVGELHARERGAGLDAHQVAVAGVDVGAQRAAAPRAAAGGEDRRPLRGSPSRAPSGAGRRARRRPLRRRRRAARAPGRGRARARRSGRRAGASPAGRPDPRRPGGERLPSSAAAPGSPLRRPSRASGATSPPAAAPSTSARRARRRRRCARASPARACRAAPTSGRPWRRRPRRWCRRTPCRRGRPVLPPRGRSAPTTGRRGRRRGPARRCAARAPGEPWRRWMWWCGTSG